VNRKKLWIDYMHILLRKGIGTCLRKIKDYQKVDFGIWEIHPKMNIWGTYLCNKLNNPKFLFNYTKLGTMDYVKNVFVQRMLKYDDDEYKIIAQIALEFWYGLMY